MNENFVKYRDLIKIKDVNKNTINERDKDEEAHHREQIRTFCAHVGG